MELPTLLVRVALVLAALGGAWALHVWFWVRRLRVPLAYDEVHALTAPDGGHLELRRLRGPQGPGCTPVLLVHGLAANHRNLDALPDASLARLLHGRGRDVWLLTLRAALPRRSRGRPARFEAMARHDLPTAVAAVLGRTASRRLDFVGFSMGGMLLYAALARAYLDAAPLRRVVALGAPAHLHVPLCLLRPALYLPRWLTPSLPLRLAARSLAFAVGFARTPLHRMLYNPANLTAAEAARAMVNVLEDIPAELGADLAALARSGTLLQPPQLARLGGVAAPALFLAGANDELAPPSAVRVAFEAWGGQDKRYRELGTRDGAPGDFGHGDLAVGHVAQAVVFPPIAAFLEGEVTS